MENNQENNKLRLISAGVTCLFSVLVLMLLFVIKLSYSYPPPPEIGVEMSQENLTDIETAGYEGMQGGGENNTDPTTAPNNDDDYSITQNSEPSNLTAKPKKTNPKKNKKEEPIVDDNALFKKGKVKTGGSGSSSSTGDGGKVGSGSGSGIVGQGASSSGTSFSLNGRGAKSLSKPKTNKDETGKVVVKITVDQQGNVVKAVAGEKGTTLMNTNLWRLCEQAAKRSKFSEKADAPELQQGTITYKFVR